jgi:hypothetical protein
MLTHGSRRPTPAAANRFAAAELCRWAAQRYHEIQRGNFDYFSNTSETTRLDGFH